MNSLRKTLSALIFASAICLGCAGLAAANPNGNDAQLNERQLEKAREILINRGEVRPANDREAYEDRYYNDNRYRRDGWDRRDRYDGYHHGGRHGRHGCWW